jgi:hypothetical protein
MVKLASVAGPASSGHCSWQSRFTVPDVAQGTYKLLWVFGGANSPQGEGVYFLLSSPFTFEVTG